MAKWLPKCATSQSWSDDDARHSASREHGSCCCCPGQAHGYGSPLVPGRAERDHPREGTAVRPERGTRPCRDGPALRSHPQSLPAGQCRRSRSSGCCAVFCWDLRRRERDLTCADGENQRCADRTRRVSSRRLGHRLPSFRGESPAAVSVGSGRRSDRRGPAVRGDRRGAAPSGGRNREGLRPEARLHQLPEEQPSAGGRRVRPRP